MVSYNVKRNLNLRGSALGKKKENVTTQFNKTIIVFGG